jgi:nicotinamide-nucleotide amidase
MAPVIEKVRETLGDIIYGMDVDSMEEQIFHLLRDNGVTLAAAESCSGGLLAKRITDLPGSSAVFLGGATVYTNDAKTKLCGVPAELIAEKTAVSTEVAQALATGIREKLGADLGVGITGVAGPDTDGVHDVGTVFVSLSTKDGVFTRSLHMSKLVLRERCRIIAVNNAFDMIRRYLTGLEI